MKRAKDVDEYIAYAPKVLQDKLKDLRAAIKEAAPEALEKISYGMPYYSYKGRLIYFAYWRDHIAVYAITAPILEDHTNELRDHVTGKGTISFSLDEKIPLALIKKLVKAQVKRNEESKNP